MRWILCLLFVVSFGLGCYYAFIETPLAELQALKQINHRIKTFKKNHPLKKITDHSLRPQAPLIQVLHQELALKHLRVQALTTNNKNTHLCFISNYQSMIHFLKYIDFMTCQQLQITQQGDLLRTTLLLTGYHA